MSGTFLRTAVAVCVAIAELVFLAAPRPAAAQVTSWTVSNADEMAAALQAAFSNNVTDPGIVNTITLGATITGTSQWVVNTNLNIFGGGHTIAAEAASSLAARTKSAVSRSCSRRSPTSTSPATRRLAVTSFQKSSGAGVDMVGFLAGTISRHDTRSGGMQGRASRLHFTGHASAEGE